MDFCEKLPRSKKEFALFIAVISVLSVNIIAPLITCFEFGFSLAVWADVLTVIPFIWLSVVALVLLTYRPAQWLTDRICAQGDSFRARDGEHTVHRAADVGLSDGDRHLDRQPQPLRVNPQGEALGWIPQLSAWVIQQARPARGAGAA